MKDQTQKEKYLRMVVDLLTDRLSQIGKKRVRWILLKINEFGFHESRKFSLIDEIRVERQFDERLRFFNLFDQFAERIFVTRRVMRTSAYR